jgi:biotin transporter BioY
MKKNIFSVLGILIAIILISKISGWFLTYSEKTNTIINSLMFIVIGIYYLIFGIGLTELNIKITFILSGIFLICMSFFPNNMVLSIIGFACIIIPSLLVKYSKELKN